MIPTLQNRSIVAIPPSYDKEERLELESTVGYLKYLKANGAQCVMTTAGTSQFNLLTTSEIHRLNGCIAASFEGSKILGIPPVSTTTACDFVCASQDYLGTDVKLMALYPDRFYSEDAVINYLQRVCEAAGDSVYLHTQKMRSGISGEWNYDCDIINKLYDLGCIVGIKEEHPNLQASYNFVRHLNPNIDVIVAGGSMRRFAFLESAGANSLLAGIGNLFPDIENEFLAGHDKIKHLQTEAKLFDVFMANGWHKSLRASLKMLNLTCLNNRNPWPNCDDQCVNKIYEVIRKLDIPVLTDWVFSGDITIDY